MIMSTFVGVVALPMAGTVDARPATAHDPAANYTFAPKDHTPGLENGAAEHYAVGLEKDLTALHTVVVSSQEFDFSDCSADKTTAFGIDRGNDDPGTQTDESLLTKYKSISFQPNKIVVKFYKEDGLGQSTVGLKTTDQIVAAGRNCYDNPDKKGWYQVSGMLNGSTNDDAKTDYEINVKTHYIYVCDCDSRQEAVDKLGPPPSEGGSGDGGSGGSGGSGGDGGSGGSTSTPTASPTASSGGGNGGGGSTSTSTATPTAGAGGRNTATTTTGTANGNTSGTANGNTSGTTTAATSATATGGSGTTATGGGNPAGGANTTPTENNGPGFGLVAALGALLASGAVALRRRD